MVVGMAKKTETIVTMTDDLDGSTASETIAFSFEGANYEIDLSKANAKAFERETLAKIGAPREVAMRHRLPQFSHLFSSDAYSAGYYSYLWSEVMDADTREAFKEAGNVFDKTVADRVRKYILAPGNSTDRSEAYRQFRGRDPDVRALMRKRGFPVQ